MFTELMPLARCARPNRPSACVEKNTCFHCYCRRKISRASADGLDRTWSDTIRVNFIPSKSDDKTESPALNQPLTITGTPAELDRQLAQQLSAFTGSILETGSTLERLKKEHDAAIKAIEAENKKKLEEKRGKEKAATPATPSSKPDVEFRDGKPVFPGTTPAATKTPGLFDAQQSDRETVAPSSR